jgi:hypothetical protein
MEGTLIVGVEAVPVDGIELECGYPASVKEDFAAGVELVMVADDISLVSYVFLGGLVDKFNQLLFGELTLGSWTYILFTQLIAEVSPVLVDKF